MTPEDIYKRRDEILNGLQAAVARIDERTMALPGIERHLVRLNGNVSDAMNKALLAESKALLSESKALEAEAKCLRNEARLMETNKRMDTLLKTAAITSLSAMGMVLYLILEVWLDVI